MLREPIDPESSARYLALAVSAQSVVDWLNAQPRQEPDPIVSGFVQGIKGLADWGSSGAAQGVREPMSFEDLNTLYDVLAPDRQNLDDEFDSLRSALERVIASREETVPTDTIDLFRRLTEEALRRADEPAEETSYRVLKLC